MANQKLSIRKHNLGARLNSVDKWKISDEDKVDLPRFISDLSLGKVNKGVRISDGRLLKYLTNLKIPLQFFQKPTSMLSIEDMERFEKALSLGTDLKTVWGRPFSHSYKVDIRRLLRIYLRWKLGDTEKFRELTDWLDTRSVNKTPDFLSEDQIDVLFKNCRNASDRFLVAVLFDSGARAEEFHNIRYEDVRLPTGNDQFIKITLKEEYSKTAGRTISLYWKHSLDAVRDFLKEKEEQGIRSNDPVFCRSYEGTRQFLHRLGERALGRSIHYHLFRHSSATFYASKLNRHQLCYRYGWKFSSDMPDVYISRAGIENKELDERLAQTEMGELKARLSRKEEENLILRDSQEKLLANQETLKIEFKREMDEIRRFLKLKRTMLPNRS